MWFTAQELALMRKLPTSAWITRKRDFRGTWLREGHLKQEVSERPIMEYDDIGWLRLSSVGIRRWAIPPTRQAVFALAQGKREVSFTIPLNDDD